MSPAFSSDPRGSHGSAKSGTEGKRSLSSLNVGFFKSLADRRANRDGMTPKRRGPKPDSRPALTRKQELNRQAQRTHRERKELYVQALEDEVLRLKELYTLLFQEKERCAQENRELKETLARHGIRASRGDLQDFTTSSNDAALDRGPLSTTSPGSSTEPGPSYPTLSPTQSTAPSISSANHGGHLPPPPTVGRTPGMTGSNGKGDVDLEQAGIDFVLTLEKPCMAHMPYLLESATDAQGDCCGHALMASCPPTSFAHLTADTPFGSTHTHDHGDGVIPCQGTWELSKAGLATLLNLSKRLDLAGEITPVMAWGILMNHPRFVDLTPGHLRRLADDLSKKVRCYGFGAVMEEFELRDALERVLTSESETPLH
ncbi:bZIP-type transcription factor [Drechmeria coniospora]|uniref:BZIP-type transcription factor n=1 Tax=Drechmeria coniospora TaxID=98403 RepID=A0A151GFW5_DRECN|nr:bZIP-type transcription factor [Drechmeria coniospora]KYK55974.1 bZIP-type transcription factor [Drechmeria coniospora]ODA76615.1 hypothetical protein RJ55_07886 [Drechmeria coniospora]